jgi:hypothetical protein
MLQRNVGGGWLARVGGGAWMGIHGQHWLFKGNIDALF